MDSNSKADFEGPIDALNEHMCLVKYHHQHKKYSINHLKHGEKKKILKLRDSKINNIHMQVSNRIIYESDGNVYMLNNL